MQRLPLSHDPSPPHTMKPLVKLAITTLYRPDTQHLLMNTPRNASDWLFANTLFSYPTMTASMRASVRSS
jgi:hypothetical protein